MQNLQHQTGYLPSQIPLPTNLNQETVRQSYEKYTQMKSSGVPENDPEFVQVRNILHAVRNMHQQRREVHQNPQHPSQISASIQIMQHGSRSGYPLPNPVETNSTMPIAENSATTGENNHAGTGLGSQFFFSEEQKLLLRHQITAFKVLYKNAPVPVEIQKTVFPSHRTSLDLKALDPAQTSSRLSISGQRNGYSSHDIQSTAHLSKGDDFQTSQTLMALIGSINYSKHGTRKVRKQIDAFLAEGVDIERVREERENIVYNRTMNRLRELELLNPGIDSWNTGYFDMPQSDGFLKRRAYIEYKMLSLLPKQRILREQVAREMVQANALATTVNRSAYRRPKRQNDHEAKFTEKLEREQRNAREIKEKKRHGAYLKSIFDHAEEVHKAAREQRAKSQRLGRMMITQHSIIEKEEQKRIERTARQRLQALKANDEETYLKLLGQAKDSRISHLLKQTDGFLKQLAASVKSQQRNTEATWDGSGELLDEPESDVDDDDETGPGKVDYYEVAHRIKEEITEQSTNLVGGKLKEYQLKGLQWMISLYNNNLNGILADEMGLGKTIQSISLITYLVEKKKQNGPFLVIVPLSTLTNWNNEFEKWAPSVSRIVYKGPPTSRKQAQQQIRYGQFQVLLTTYEFIIKDRPVLSKIKWLHMIVDEGHRMKNSNSKLSSTITQYYTTRYRVILTGTPLQNNISELWALLNFVLPTIFKSVKSFEEWFNTPFANTGGQDKMELTEEEQLLVIRRLHKVLHPFLLRRLKKDVEKDLPDKQERVIKCNFSSLQARLNKQLMTTQKLMVSDGKGGKTGMRGLSNMLMQLRKLCNHPFVFEEVEDQINPQRLTNDLIWRTSGKFELLDRILPKFKATGHRVLMFFQMTQIMNIMEDFMRLRGYEYLRLDGSTKSDERADLLQLFNAEDSKYFCFLLSTRAGGLGLNLQTADTVIIFDSDWNPHQDLQAQDRAHRIGQKSEVRILRLISSNSVEEKILERANYKLDMDSKVIQAGKFDNKSTNEERDAMLRVMLETAEAAESLEPEEMDDDDLNMLMMRSEEELEVFQKLDAERAEDPLYGPGRKYPRLLGESELPEIYLQDDEQVTEEIEEIYGRGARERTRVRYDDGLTEEQWADAVDNDEDSIEAAIARKEEKVARRVANKEKKHRSDTGAGESPIPSRESSESPAPKKRGRKPNRDKRKADEAALDSESFTNSVPPKKRGRHQKAVETLGEEERSTLQKVLNNIFESLNQLQESSSVPGERPRDIIDPFTVLPDRKAYADYYLFIKKPICMEQISEKINGKWYQNLNSFADDIKLLCTNCKTYNEDGSLLFEDAKLIEKTTLALLRSETAANPGLGVTGFVYEKYSTSNGRAEDSGLTEKSSDDWNSTLATPGGTKLKLSFNRASIADGVVEAD